MVALYGSGLGVTNNEFYDGLKVNYSIHSLTLDCSNSNIGGAGQNILEAYQENNNLTQLRIINADLQNGEENIITTTLRNNTSISNIWKFN